MADRADDEQAPLLPHNGNSRLTKLIRGDEQASSIISSHLTREERKVGESAVGERLPYNDYTTIDWLHDLVKDSYRLRFVQARKGLRFRILALFDAASGWIAAALIGALTACVAFLIDIATATISDWKSGYCVRNPLLSRQECCGRKALLLDALQNEDASSTGCRDFKPWSNTYASTFAIYVAFALAYGIISGSVTLLTKRSLPAASPGKGDKDRNEPASHANGGKTMLMAAGSGIPELKTILSGFVIPHFLDFKVMVVKGIGAIFAVSTGLCLGKEGPFVHIGACVGYLVSRNFPKYRDNGRKMREMLSAACAAGLAVAFGVPIGGVLFSYEEISTYFPRKVLWRSFLCSLVAAMVLRALNPNGTGKLALFETHYGTSYNALHYLVFILLGIVGGIFGGVFCKLNFLWSKWFRHFSIIKNNPIFEVFLVTLVSSLVQYPNLLTRDTGDVIIGKLLVDCKHKASSYTWVCRNEAQDDNWAYIGWLIYGTLAKLILTIITFGIKVPSGVIIPALDAGAFFGRLVGQWVGNISPGIFAMVGSAAFLAGVSRMTISLCVVMFELTGELEYIVPHMIAVLVAKWVADAMSKEGVYDLAQTVLGHPFLDLDHSVQIVQREDLLVEHLIPPDQTMDEITVHVPESNKVPRRVLEEKLQKLHERGLMDGGLVLVQHDSVLQGYVAEAELEFGLSKLGQVYAPDADVRLLGEAEEGDFDMSNFVDQTPVTVCAKAPLEYAVEMFGKLGLRHLMVLEKGTGKLVGVIIKKRLVAYMDSLK